jgi:hypothetical protein
MKNEANFAAAPRRSPFPGRLRVAGCFVAVILAAQVEMCQENSRTGETPPAVVPTSRTMPVLQKTAARDSMGFKYNVPEKVKKALRFAATPETGT